MRLIYFGKQKQNKKMIFNFDFEIKNKNMRTFTLIPKEYYDELYKQDYCKHQMMVLLMEYKIPYMIIYESDNEIVCKLDSCCNCECPNRYKTYYIEKDGLKTFIKTQMEDNVLIDVRNIDDNN